MATAREEITVSRPRAPETPTALAAQSWGGAFRRTLTEFRQDNLTDLAAALTYYGILAIFPAIIERS